MYVAYFLMRLCSMLRMMFERRRKSPAMIDMSFQLNFPCEHHGYHLSAVSLYLSSLLCVSGGAYYVYSFLHLAVRTYCVASYEGTECAFAGPGHTVSLCHVKLLCKNMQALIGPVSEKGHKSWFFTIFYIYQKNVKAWNIRKLWLLFLLVFKLD